MEVEREKVENVEAEPSDGESTNEEDVHGTSLLNTQDSAVDFESDAEETAVQTLTVRPLSKCRKAMFASSSAVAITIAVALIVLSHHGDGDSGPNTDLLCPIFCHGDILRVVQLSGITDSSKDFVDMPMKDDPDVVLASWNALPNYEPSTLRGWLSAHFLPAGSDIESFIPPDFDPNPPFLGTIRDLRYRAWMRNLTQLWPTLVRKPVADVYTHPLRHSLLPVRHLMLIPGGRFREVYYWDTYWIVQGLLISGMRHSARMLVENLLAQVAEFGRVPNGNRRYYLDRSQPPFLTAMVQRFAANVTFLQEALPLLEREYLFWMGGAHAVHLEETVLNRYYADVSFPRPESYREDVLTGDQLLADSFQRTPSLSAWLSHVPSARVFGDDLGGNTSEALLLLFSNLAAGAESGWDFSSRWLDDHRTLHRCVTRDIIPVDLNAVMCANERMLALQHAKVAVAALRGRQLSALCVASAACGVGGFAVVPSLPAAWAQFSSLHVKAIRTALHSAQLALDGVEASTRDTASPVRTALQTAQEAVEKSEMFWAAFEKRRVAVERWLWQDEFSSWVDYNHRKGEPAYVPIHTASGPALRHVVSNFLPLWAGCHSPALNATRVLQTLLNSGLVGVGGLATTTDAFETGQQWDYPNAWPPLQQLIVEACHITAIRLEADARPQEAQLFRYFAFDLSDRWVRNNYLGWNRTGVRMLPSCCSDVAQFMFEKYSARSPGFPGGGGEYKVQVVQQHVNEGVTRSQEGFGWTNGVAMWLFQLYGDRLQFE